MLAIEALRHNPGMPVPRLETDRLILRDFACADRQPFASMNADEEVRKGGFHAT